ncbi:MAG: hypothetical protein ACK5LY_04495 [Lachnospirales bacterium]
MLIGILYSVLIMDEYTRVVAFAEVPKYMAILVLINLPLLSYLLYDDKGEVFKYLFNFILYILFATIYMDIVAKVYLHTSFALSDFVAMSIFAIYFQGLIIEDMVLQLCYRIRIAREEEEEDYTMDSFI